MSPALVFPSRLLGGFPWSGNRTLVLGVVNCTPDSFSDGGRHTSVDSASARVKEMVKAGADAIDIGGESTRPGATPITIEEEIRRVIPLFLALRGQAEIPLSIDTTKSEVAQAAVDAGASIINDISGLSQDDDMIRVISESKSTVIIGHLRGTPGTMQDRIAFNDVVSEVIDELKRSVWRAIAGGVSADRIWIDPGIGFGKRTGHTLALIQALARIRSEVGYPLMVGLSRKSFIGELTGDPVEDRLMGTCAATSAAIALGADGVRIHDVAELAPALRVVDAICRADQEENDPVQ